ncbi:MAG: GxxExxY protein [Bacteroidales bacterium]|nr:GxxExxY protein [Bacteroidales bacterium]
MKSNFKHSDISEKIIKAFYNVYNELGYGFLEKVYEKAMMIELKDLGLERKRQQAVEVLYKNQNIGDYYPDIIVEDNVIVELKAVKNIIDEHEIQLVNYLKATNIEVGLILNFGPKPQITRRVLTKEYKNKIKKIDADFL